MLNSTFSTQTDMLDSTFSTFFHIWVHSVENVDFDTRNLSEFYQDRLEAFLQFFSVTAPAQSMGLKPGGVSGLV